MGRHHAPEDNDDRQVLEPTDTRPFRLVVRRAPDDMMPGSPTEPFPVIYEEELR